MKRFRLPLFVLLACALSASASAAEFSADMVTEAQGDRVEGRIFSAPGKLRFEMPGAVVITRLDKQVAWTVMAEEGMYLEQAVDPKAAVSSTKDVPGELERASMGKENVNGRDAEKFKVSYTQDGRTETVYQWIDDEAGLPVRVAAGDGSWQVDYLNVRIGPQPAGLFEVPAEFRKMPMPSMADLMAGELPGE